jgi:hypothetical protein
MTQQTRCRLVSDGRDLFLIFECVKIAKRGRPGTPQADTWIVLEPGFAVYDGGDAELVIERDGVRVH